MSVLLGFIKNSSIVYFEILNSSFIFFLFQFLTFLPNHLVKIVEHLFPLNGFISLLSFKAFFTPLELVATFETIAVLLDFPKKPLKLMFQ